MTYEEAINFVQSAAAAGIKPGLERISALAARLGNPHRRLRCVHVGGTNGKGSTVSMLASILAAGGYKVGMFTSPHLHSYTERFRVNGRTIPPGRFAAVVAEVKPELRALGEAGVVPTEFEIHTALAFKYFAEEGVDMAVIEVGLGGRFDATNIILPEVTVITNVAVDHTDYLGDDIRGIAGEKAGIAKRRVPMVTGADGEALAVIKWSCQALHAPLYVLGRDFYPLPNEEGLGGQVLDVYGWWGESRDLIIRVLGRHQQENAAIAVAAARLLAENGWRLDGSAVKKGLATAVWPGRFEIISGQPTVVLDGAHNTAGAVALKQALEDYFPHRRLVLVMGMLADKERHQAVGFLCPMAAAVVVTRPPGLRAGDWRELATFARQEAAAVYEVEDIPAAVAQGLALAGPEDVVVITGSLYLIAEARAVLVGQEALGLNL